MTTAFRRRARTEAKYGGAPRRDIAYTLDHLVLDAEAKTVSNVNLREVIADSSFSLTMEGASTLELTISDPNRKLLRSDLLTRWSWGKNADDRDERHWIREGRNVDLKLDDLWFRLVNLNKQGGGMLVLTFEDREVAKLRAHRGARKSVRSDHFTRAMFVAALCRAAGVSCHIPELKVVQPIGETSEPLGVSGKTTTRSESASKGLDRSGGLRGSQGPLSSSALDAAERAMDIAASLHAPSVAVAALLEALMVEAPDFYNNPGGDGTSSGPLQLLSSTAAGLGVNPRDYDAVVRLFLERGFTGRGGAIALARTGMSSGEIAQAVQGSAYPSRYGAVQPQALALMRAYHGGGSLGSSSFDVTVEKPYEFSRGKNETSWDAIQRLAEEVNWRAFMRRGVLWYISDDRLIKQQPELGFRESDDAVDEVTFEIDLNARDLVAELQVVAHAHRWTALPGMVAKAAGEGAADGRWIVHTIERALQDDMATVTCQKPVPKKKEPAPETETKHVEGESGGAVDASGWPVALKRAWDAARAIDSRHYPYLWGGGHNSSFSGPYDCSGGVSAVLHAAGLLGSPLDSSSFMSYGDSGAGRYITLFTNPQHIFMSFKLPGGSHEIFWGTSGENPGGGAGFHSARSASGFVVRHPRGL